MWKINIVLVIFTFCFCVHTSERSKLIELIHHQQSTKNNFAIQDAYKLLYQSVFGIEHILADSEKAKNYLTQELESVSATDNEPLIEEISLDGTVVRLNLRPYKYRNGNVEQLFSAMLRSAEERSGSQEKFVKLWEQFKQAVFDGELIFVRAELENFDRKVRSENYPVMHHSTGYQEANQPAYRVLKKEAAKELLSTQDIYFP